MSRAGVIYDDKTLNDASASNKSLIAYVDFGGDRSVQRQARSKYSGMRLVYSPLDLKP